MNLVQYRAAIKRKGKQSMRTRQAAVWMTVLTAVLIFISGCAPVQESEKTETIPFGEGQLYAVAYVGYLEPENLSYYTERYLDSDRLPVHHFSPGEYWLVIPRYEDMELQLYYRDMNTEESVLVYEEPNCRAFLIQCNVSDIFPDAEIRLSRGENAVSFSPYISLENGEAEVGEYGLNLADEQK